MSGSQGQAVGPALHPGLPSQSLAVPGGTNWGAGPQLWYDRLDLQGGEELAPTCGINSIPKGLSFPGGTSE